MLESLKERKNNLMLGACRPIKNDLLVEDKKERYVKEKSKMVGVSGCVFSVNEKWSFLF